MRAAASLFRGARAEILVAREPAELFELRNAPVATPDSAFAALDHAAAEGAEGLAREGYSVRVYVPYGKTWYPYFMRRLAERPANVAFMTANVVKEMVGGRNGKR